MELNKDDIQWIRNNFNTTPAGLIVSNLCDEIERLGMELMENELAPDRLYKAIAHGDEEHREWLKKAIYAFWSDKPVPPPSGLGTVDALKEENLRLREFAQLAAHHTHPWDLDKTHIWEDSCDICHLYRFSVQSLLEDHPE